MDAQDAAGYSFSESEDLGFYGFSGNSHEDNNRHTNFLNSSKKKHLTTREEFIQAFCIAPPMSFTAQRSLTLGMPYTYVCCF